MIHFCEARLMSFVNNKSRREENSPQFWIIKLSLDRLKYVGADSAPLQLALVIST